MKIAQYFARIVVLAVLAFLATACGSGGGGSSGSSNAPSGSSSSSASSGSSGAVVQGNSSSGTVQNPNLNLLSVQGSITYDRIPFEGTSYRGLDYSQSYVTAARGVTVQLLDESGSVLASTITDANGQYEFGAEKNIQARIRVVAELMGVGAADWDIKVKDNTNGNAQYVMDGSLANTGDADVQTRDLHAASGWTGADYTETRSAAPFAILDSIYDALQLVLGSDPSVVLPPLNVYWSPDNIAINGSLTVGYIGTSFYTSAGPSIYLLGAKNNDSDEYDRAVVQHEFGHYLEHQLGRTESIGGSHNISSRLDMRVAFGEAWGNAFAGMAANDPIYRDSLGATQGQGFAIDVENLGWGRQGWFSEGSIQSLIYDVFDANADGSDNIELGFNAIYNVLTSDTYLNFEGMASVYPFVEVLKQQNPDQVEAISSLVESLEIYGSGFYGDGETNDAGSAVVLPVYSELSVGETINVCSDSDYQDYNGVDVRRFIKLNISSRDDYRITATKNGGGLSRTNPQMRLYQAGSEKAYALSSTVDSESISRELSSGTYVLEVFEKSNADGSSSNGGLACFDVSVN